MRLIIVSGRSGSGKSTALDVLEDNGFYCIDNLPAGLLPELAERALLHTELLHPQVAVSIDARNLPSHLQRFPELLEEVRARHIKCDVIYLDADEETLLKRFSETRRRHPLTNESRSLAEAIADEALLLGPIPYWKPDLRDFSGLDQPVADYLSAQTDVEDMYQDILAYLTKWLPRFAASNRAYVTVAIGCTGGHHRSVYLANRLGETLKPILKNVQTRHRDLS